jgi:hypothetical protein
MRLFPRDWAISRREERRRTDGALRRILFLPAYPREIEIDLSSKEDMDVLCGPWHGDCLLQDSAGLGKIFKERRDYEVF